MLTRPSPVDQGKKISKDVQQDVVTFAAYILLLELVAQQVLFLLLCWLAAKDWKHLQIGQVRSALCLKIFKTTVLVLVFMRYFIVKVKKMDNADPKSTEIDIAIAQMIAVDDQPFSVVENRGFINLIKKVHVFVRDNDANIKRILEDSGLKSVSCAAHNLNLIVTNEQDAVKRIQSTCREISGLFHRSDSSRKKLKEIQQQLNETKPALKLIQESKTFWNSTYQMMKRITELKESILLLDQEWDMDWNMNWKLIPKNN
uniref:Uncharacterized protein n=1 Tax=Romanomermis culicivorax TaxID=13658 RepID=A0A915HY85_ROMCU